MADRRSGYRCGGGNWCPVGGIGKWCALATGGKWCALTACGKRRPLTACGKRRSLAARGKRRPLAARGKRCRRAGGGGRRRWTAGGRRCRWAFCLAPRRLRLHPDDQIPATGVVHDTVGALTSDVEVDLARGLLAWGEGGWVDPRGAGYLEQGSVRLAVFGAGVEIRHHRDDGAFEGFVGGGGFPEGAAYLVGDRVRAGSEVADGPALNDGPVGHLRLVPNLVGGGSGVVGGCSRCADADDSCGGNGSCGQFGRDLQGGSLLSRRLANSPPIGVVSVRKLASPSFRRTLDQALVRPGAAIAASVSKTETSRTPSSSFLSRGNLCWVNDCRWTSVELFDQRLDRTNGIGGHRFFGFGVTDDFLGYACGLGGFGNREVGASTGGVQPLAQRGARRRRP